MKLNALSVTKPIRKDTLVDISTAMVHSVPELLQMATVWKFALANAKITPASIKSDNTRILSIMRVSKVSHDLPTTVASLLPNMAVNLQLLSMYIIDKFPNEYNDKTATVRQQVTLAYLGLFYHISMYLPDMVNIQLKLLASMNSDSDLYEIPARKKAELEEGLTTFAVAIDVLGITPDHFESVFTTGYPEVESKSGIDALLAANGVSNPIARVKDGFRGNPFFSIGQWVNTTVVEYVKYMEDRKTVSKLYLEQIKAEHASTGSPAAAKEIELLEEEIKDIEYKLHKAGV